MKVLEKIIEDGKFLYTQVQREDMVAIYTQEHKFSGTIRYEVIRIRKYGEHTWPTGLVTPPYEGYPGSTSWGCWAGLFFIYKMPKNILGDLWSGFVLNKPEPPWNFDFEGYATVCELSLPQVALVHRVVLKSGLFCVYIREKRGEIWCLARKKTLEEAMYSILWHINYFQLWKSGSWHHERMQFRTCYRKPDWL